MPESGFRHLYLKVVGLLEALQAPYLMVGGMATGVLGEPRLTHDVDVILGVRRKDIARVLKKAKEAGFHFDDQRVRKDIRQIGSSVPGPMGTPDLGGDGGPACVQYAQEAAGSLDPIQSLPHNPEVSKPPG